MEISIFSILNWFTAILISSLALVIYLGSRTYSSRAFVHCLFWVAMWISFVGVFVNTKNLDNALFYSRLTYYLGSMIAASFLYFFFTYPEDTRPNKLLLWSLIILQLASAYIYLFTDLIISRLDEANFTNFHRWSFGPLSFIFELAFFGFFIVGVAILYIKYKKCKNSNIRSNLRYMLWTIVVGATPPSLMCIILPRFGYYDLNWLGPITEIIWIPIIAYSIIHYRQMNVRAIITEVLAIAMSAIFFVNIFIDTSFGIVGKIATFIIFLILAYFLVKGILREAGDQEKLRILNVDLELKVSEQTIELRNAFDLEKKARRELEKLNETKDQFIMITQHHLRTPVTSIKWSLEEMQNGVYGTISPALKQAMENAGTAVNRLTRIVDDFLSITAIKVGAQILNLSKESIRPLLDDVLSELRYDIEHMHLRVTYPLDTASWPELLIDAGKMREVLLIITENAVRYNVDGGSIDITTRINDGMFELIMVNTGLGIDEEDKIKIFTSLFHRSAAARTTHPIGMGIGLSVSRAIVRAHHGELRIDSEGRGKGAKVSLVLPIENVNVH